MSFFGKHDAQHPSRLAAIDILEFLIGDHAFKKEPKGEEWYRLEDKIAELINKRV